MCKYVIIMKLKKYQFGLLFCIVLIISQQIFPTSGLNIENSQEERVFIANVPGSMTVSNLDPHITVQGHPISDQVTEGLLLYNRSELPAKLELQLATSYNWIDDRTLEFTLRDDVEFHDGRRVE